jgi:pentatricopeptide repeat protein
MEERYRRGDKAAKLDIIKYTTCISALAKEGLPHRAECLLKKMEYDHRNGNKSARPDAKNFEMIISSWSGFYDTHHAVNEMRAEKLLQMMWTLGQQPAFAHIRPGVLAYTRVMEAMAKKNNPERSEKLLNEMVTFHKLGRLPAGPDVHTYHVAIDAWANSNRQEGLLRAGQLRTQMNRQLGLEK